MRKLLRNKLESLLSDAAVTCQTPVEMNRFIGETIERFEEERLAIAEAHTDLINFTDYDLIHYHTGSRKDRTLLRPGSAVPENWHKLSNLVRQN